MLIRLSERLIQAPRSILEETLCHELAHIAAKELNGSRTGPHGPAWAALMRGAGFKPRTRLPYPCNELPLRERRSRQRHLYVHHCPVCQMERIAHRAVKRWRSRACWEAGHSSAFFTSPRFSLFLSDLRRRKMIHALAAFLGGGWVLLEVVHRLPAQGKTTTCDRTRSLPGVRFPVREAQAFVQAGRMPPVPLPKDRSPRISACHTGEARFLRLAKRFDLQEHALVLEDILAAHGRTLSPVQPEGVSAAPQMRALTAAV